MPVSHMIAADLRSNPPLSNSEQEQGCAAYASNAIAIQSDKELPANYFLQI